MDTTKCSDCGLESGHPWDVKFEWCQACDKFYGPLRKLALSPKAIARLAYLAGTREDLSANELVALLTIPPEGLKKLSLEHPNLSTVELIAISLATEPACSHGVIFDEEVAQNLSSDQVRHRWPRLHGTCPLGCGYSGIYYASPSHYISGDW